MKHVNGQLHESCLKEQPVKEHPLILEMAVFQPDLTLPQACVWKGEMMEFQVRPKHHLMLLRP